MLEKVKELVNTIDYINKNDHEIEIDIKFLNSTMCIVCKNAIGMSKVDITCREELEKVLVLLNTRKTVVSEMTITEN